MLAYGEVESAFTSVANIFCHIFTHQFPVKPNKFLMLCNAEFAFLEELQFAGRCLAVPDWEVESAFCHKITHRSPIKPKRFLMLCIWLPFAGVWLCLIGRVGTI